MDWASRFAYVFDLGWFLVFTCVPILVVAILILLRGGPWPKADIPASPGLTTGRKHL
ncbi:MAG TPA: hypothetical protein VHL05_15850 [Terriglobales bacterium]|jgi:hypothetical protein|nr:hypothetical protein [Terriglobales bacterium]HMC74661.1 hypothetical protein [Terriglobales bacterium]